MLNYLHPMPNFWEAFMWRNSSAQGAKDRRRAQNSLKIDRSILQFAFAPIGICIGSANNLALPLLWPLLKSD